MPLPAATVLHSYTCQNWKMCTMLCIGQVCPYLLSLSPTAVLVALQTRRLVGGLTLKERARLQALPKGFIRDTAHGALTWWNTVEPSKQPLYIVSGISLAVWGLWSMPFLARFMARNFVQALPPAAESRRVLPMLLVSKAAQSEGGSTGRVQQLPPSAMAITC